MTGTGTLPTDPEPPQAPPAATWFRLGLAFAQVSVSSVGGGTVAWIREVLVHRRGWLSDDEFSQALAVSQLLPGPNTLNLAVFCGSALAGWRGALAASLGLLLLPTGLVLALGVVYGHLEQGPAWKGIFRGLGAAAAGVALGTGLQLGSRFRHERTTVLTALLVVLALAGLRLPLPLVVLLTLLLTYPRSQR